MVPIGSWYESINPPGDDFGGRGPVSIIAKIRIAASQNGEMDTRGIMQSDLLQSAKGFSLPSCFCQSIFSIYIGGRTMENRNSVGYFSVQVKLEACYNLLIAAKNEEEAINAAFNEDLPARRIEDISKDVVRVVQMKQRVYVC